MKEIPVEDAVGTVICHDITRIIPGKEKGTAFKKGHIVRKEDIPTLLDIGKKNLYILNLTPDQIHENEAAVRIAKAVAGKGIRFSELSEGRVNLIAEKGLLVIDTKKLKKINSISEIVLSTMHTNFHVTEARAVAGARIIPLITERKYIEEVEELCKTGEPVVQVKPFLHHKIGIVTTGSEIYSGRIKDKFGDVIRSKFSKFPTTILGQTFVPDSEEMTKDAILDFLKQGADMVVVTGGMSVDPDDRTPSSIRATGAKVVSYGTPTFPGSMFMLSYHKKRPILGLPGCVMYHKASIFDLLVPVMLTGKKISRKDIISLGHGGFCADCETCHYPLCSFGKCS